MTCLSLVLSVHTHVLCITHKVPLLHCAFPVCSTFWRIHFFFTWIRLDIILFGQNHSYTQFNEFSVLVWLTNQLKWGFYWTGEGGHEHTHLFGAMAWNDVFTFKHIDLTAFLEFPTCMRYLFFFCFAVTVDSPSAAHHASAFTSSTSAIVFALRLI